MRRAQLVTRNQQFARNRNMRYISGESMRRGSERMYENYIKIAGEIIAIKTKEN